MDSAGNLYIADSTECREVAATNHTQFGIPMTANYIYAVDVADQTSSYSAVAVDSYGNLYIADLGNSSILKVDASGAITTVAGTGTYGYNGDGIPATSAELYMPSDMALDSAGDLYIADEGNKRIREVLVAGGQTAAAPLAITTGFLPPGTEGMAYDTTLAASGGTAPYTWKAAGLPDGLGIDPGQGRSAAHRRPAATSASQRPSTTAVQRSRAAAPSSTWTSASRCLPSTPPACHRGEWERPTARAAPPWSPAAELLPTPGAPSGSRGAWRSIRLAGSSAASRMPAATSASLSASTTAATRHRAAASPGAW